MRTGIVTAFGAFALLGSHSVIGSTPENATSDMLLRSLRIAHDNYQKQIVDRFYEGGDVELSEGDEFLIEFPILDGARSGIMSGGSSLWIYENGVFTAWISPDSVGSISRPDIEGEVMFFDVVREQRGSYLGENAFGVQRQIEQWTIKESGILPVTFPSADFSPYSEERDRRFLSPETIESMRTDYVYSVSLSGDEARHLAENITARINGSITKSNGKGVQCEHFGRGPTINHPIDMTIQRCWVPVRIFEVQFIDGSTGELLKSWIDSKP